MSTWCLLLVGVLAVATAQASHVPASVVCNISKGEKVRFDAWGENGIRARLGVDPSIEQKQQALLPQTTVAPEVVDGDNCSLVSGNLQASVKDGKIVFTRVSDQTVVVMEETHALCSTCGPLNLGNASMSFASSPDERIFGMGEHPTGKLDNHGLYLDFMDAGVYDHHNASDIVIPFYLSSNGYSFLWNTAAFGYFNSSDHSIAWGAMTAQVIDFHVAVANASSPNYKQLMTQYAESTGFPPEMPQFATGFWQCKNRYRTQAEVMDVAHEYKQRGLPISVIVIDYLHWDHFGDFSLNEACWPDPAAMVKELDDMGIRVMISIWPFVQGGSVHGQDYNATGPSVNFQPMLDGGMLVQDSATGKQAPVFKAPFWESNPPTNNMYILDPFNPDTRQYVFAQLKENYMKYGINTFWLDEAEPERHSQDINTRFGYADGIDSAIGLSWSRAEQQMIYDGLREEGVDDIFMLSRSFFVGGARYGAGAWSGDINSTFDSLHQQVRAGQNVAVSGLHWWTTDIGGYTGGDPSDPVYQQLIIRWFQFGAFCPLFRLHGDRKPRTVTSCGRSGAPDEVWHYGDEAYASIVPIMEMRETLRPYISQVMVTANKTGVPPLRALFLEFPDDEGVWQHDEVAAGSFMLGPEILLSPVTTYNATKWPVYLPKLPSAVEWIHHYTNQTYAGGQLVEMDVSDLDTFPLFKRTDSSLQF